MMGHMAWRDGRVLGRENFLPIRFHDEYANTVVAKRTIARVAAGCSMAGMPNRITSCIMGKWNR